MRFYNKQHKNYCGIDLHTNKMYVCIINYDGKTVFHRNMKAAPETFLRAIKPFREDLVVSAVTDRPKRATHVRPNGATLKWPFSGFGEV